MKDMNKDIIKDFIYIGNQHIKIALRKSKLKTQSVILYTHQNGQNFFKRRAIQSTD